MTIEPNPFRCVQDGFGCERPAFKVELLELVPVTFDHNVFIIADALDLLHRGFQLVQTQIVQGAERDHQIEMFVTERIAVLSAIAEQIGLDVIASFGEAVLGNIESGDLQVGQDLFHFVEQEGLAATDVENLRPVLEAVDVDQGFRDRGPTALNELVPAVSVAAVAVPIVEFVFLRLHHAVDLVVHHPRQVIPLGRLVERRHDFQQSTHSHSSFYLNPKG